MMDLVKHLLAVFLVLTALTVAVNLIATPLYHDGRPDYPVWKVVNWFMVGGTVIMLVVNLIRRHCMGGEETRNSVDSLRVSLSYYGAIVLTMLFFWEWFWSLNPESETGGAVTSHLIYFPFMDSLYTVLGLSTGRFLWKGIGK